MRLGSTNGSEGVEGIVWGVLVEGFEVIEEREGRGEEENGRGEEEQNGRGQEEKGRGKE